MSPGEAVKSLVYFKADPNLKPFDHSGIHDPGIEPFPESRPAATDRAKATGESMGVKSKPASNGERSSAGLDPAAPPATEKGSTGRSTFAPDVAGELADEAVSEAG